jgi:co-chaperonin GroES (HSP10)
MIDQIIDNEDPGVDLDNFNFAALLNQYEGIEPVGWQLLIRIYIPLLETKIGNIMLSDESISKRKIDARFSNLCGIVVKIAPGAYRDLDRYSLTGPYCEVEDWVYFPRASGSTFSYNGLTSIFINEDTILGIVKDPRNVTRLKNT